jgi:hypothetical protein
MGRRTRQALAGTVIAALCLAMTSSCARVGRLTYVAQPVSPVSAKGPRVGTSERGREVISLRPLFGDTAIGLVPGTGDTARRFLGRLRDGYAADTLNFFIMGDNRPGWNASRLAPEYDRIHQIFSGRPQAIALGLVTIPWAIVKGLVPDLALLRDVPAKLRNMPTAGRERQVVSAMLAKIDSMRAHGKMVAAVVNSGDLLADGRYPAHWRRFLRITQPLSSRVPYFPVAGNHERTDDTNGVENWRAATGLPVAGDRLYYCFDTADGWVRVIALDSNPIVDPGGHWSRDVQVKYSQEEFRWLTARVKEHPGPVIVVMHHPPFSSGYHRMEWQEDSVLSKRREQMVRSLHEAGISVVVSGHEHAYERALLTWPDAVLIAIATGGGGAPLIHMPPQAQSARLFSEYRVAGSTVKPENTFTAEVYHFVHLRIWFGGGQLITYAVDKGSHATQIDSVQIDLKRYGIPKVDQHKIPVPPSSGPKLVAEAMEGGRAHAGKGKVDTVSASRRILSHPPPGKRRHRTNASGGGSRAGRTGRPD